jgi:hypothetical protein
MRAKLVLAVATVALIGIVAPGVARAAEPPNQRFIVIDRVRISGGDAEPTASVVVGHGVLDAAGRDEFQPSQADDPPNVDRGVFVFPQGTLAVRVTNLSFTGGTPDPRTCVVDFVQTGSWDITGGTGAYTGASGALSFTLQGTGMATRLPDGECAAGEGTFILLSTATGNLSLPMT